MASHGKRTTKPVPNVSGRVTLEDAPPTKSYERGDFFRDLKKVVRKLPPDHPSRSGSEKR